MSACNDPSTSVPPGPDPDQSTIVVTTPPPFVAGKGLVELTITAKDSSGIPIEGLTVELELDPEPADYVGRAVLTNPPVVTNAEGVTVGSLSFPTPEKGAFTLKVIAKIMGVTLSQGIEIPFTPPAAEASRLAFEGVPQGTTPPVYFGKELEPFTVKFLSEEGALIANDARPVRINIAPDGPTLSGSLEVAPIAGVATFTGIKINTSTPLEHAKAYRLFATVSAVGAKARLSAQSEEFAVGVDVPVKLAVEIASKPTVAGQTFSFKAMAKDAFSNTVPSYVSKRVFFSCSIDGVEGSDCIGLEPAPHGALPGPYTFTKEDKGAHTFEDAAAFIIAGSKLRLIATSEDGTLKGESEEFQLANSDPAGVVAVVRDTLGQVIEPIVMTSGVEHSLAIAVVDAYGNVCADPAFVRELYFSWATATAPGGLAGLPATSIKFTAVDLGAYEFSPFSIGQAGTFSLSITPQGLASGKKELSIKVEPDTTAALATLAFPLPFSDSYGVRRAIDFVTAGASTPLVVEVQDPHGNRLSSIAAAAGQTLMVRLRVLDASKNLSGEPADLTQALTGKAYFEAPLVSGVASFPCAQGTETTCIKINSERPVDSEVRLQAELVGAAAQYQFKAIVGKEKFSVEDMTPPAKVVFEPSVSDNWHSITFKWKHPGDDGNEGSVAGYELYWSTSDSLTIPATPIDPATPGFPLPGAQGTLVSFTLDSTDLNPNTDYYLRVVAYDDKPGVPNKSEVSAKVGRTKNCDTGWMTDPGDATAKCAVCAPLYTFSGQPGVCEDKCTAEGAANLCNNPPAGTCTADLKKAIPKMNPGTCSIGDSVASPYKCSYSDVAQANYVDCTASGKVCFPQNGQCITNHCASCETKTKGCGYGVGTVLIYTNQHCDHEWNDAHTDAVANCKYTESLTYCDDKSACHFEDMGAGEPKCLTRARAALPGDLLITELHAGTSPQPSWIELRNLSASPVSLADVTLHVGAASYALPNGAKSHAPVRIEPAGHVVLSSGDISGIEANAYFYAVGGLSLPANSAVTVELRRGTLLLERFDVPASFLPANTAKALSKNFVENGYTANPTPVPRNTVAFWCAPAAATPGKANADCAGAPGTRLTAVDAGASCSLLTTTFDHIGRGAPISAELALSSAAMAGRVQAGNDRDPYIMVKLGLGDSRHPSEWPTSSWQRAYYAATSGTGNTDHFVGRYETNRTGFYSLAWKVCVIPPECKKANPEDCTAAPGQLSCFYCGTDGKLADSGTVQMPSVNISEEGVADWSKQIRDLRMGGEKKEQTIGGAYVTWVRPYNPINGEVAAFSVQAEKDGQAIWVLSSATGGVAVEAGDLVKFVATEKVISPAKIVTKVSSFSVVQRNAIDVATLVSTLPTGSDYALVNEGRLLKVTGQIIRPPLGDLFKPSLGGYYYASFEAYVMSGSSIVSTSTNQTLRLPQELVSRWALDENTCVTVTSPLAGISELLGSSAQITAWNDTQIALANCPALKIVGVASDGLETVRVTFNRAVDGASLQKVDTRDEERAENGPQANNIQFRFVTGGTVKVKNAVLSATDNHTVVLTTGTMTPNGSYTIGPSTTTGLGTSVRDVRGISWDLQPTPVFVPKPN